MEEVFEDLSPWHHLIFCEELLNNDEENHVVCSRCHESVLGCPAYKCLECNFLQHKSCIQSPDSPTTRIKLQSHRHSMRSDQKHHLIFVEEVDNGGKEEVVCPGCQEPAFGPAYKCSFYPEYCTFFLHKSCIELSHVIHHSVHPKHILILQRPSYTNCCDVCRKYCAESIFYRCSPCDFDIDIKCVSRWGISAEDCHKHDLFPMRKQMQFTCEACAEESNDIAYQCNVCRVLIHRKCAHFPHTIKIRTHHHSLTRTYFLRQYEQRDNVLCELCRQKVNTEYAVYYCRQCYYIAHLYCTRYLEDEYEGRSATIDEADATQLVHLVEGINLADDERAGPQEIEHFSHLQHNLFLTNEKLMDDMRCEACMQFIISVPFYGCVECKFFLHYRCTKLPAKIKRGLFHEHPLTLLSQDLDAASGLFECIACSRYRHGFTYKCDECEEFNLDIQCCLIPRIIKYECHQHSLHLIITADETCHACGREGVNFRCTDCNNFTLCFRCATLPFVARYEYDSHLLKLSSTREDDFGEYYCLICEEERDSPDHWFYYCVKCKFTAHSRCVLGENPCINYGRTFTHKDHEHPLTIIQKSKHSPPCNECGCSFNGMAIECTQCKFNVDDDICLERLCKKILKNSLLN